MKSINTYYTNQKELTLFIEDQKIKNSSSLLIQVFSAISGKDFISTLLSELTLLLPDSVIIGSTTDGEIMDGHISSDKVVLSFSQFDNTRLQATAVEHTLNGYNSGQYLAKALITDDTKLLIAFVDGLHTNGEEFLNGIASVNDDVIVAGGHAGDNSHFVETLVFTKDHIVTNGAVAVTLSSEHLHIHTDYSFNWHPIGNDLTITRAEGNRVYTIDGKSAVETYAHYLGEDIAKGLPGIGIEFPLIVNRDGSNISRACIAKEEDGSLIVGGNLYTGEKVRIGYGNSKEILEKSQQIMDSTSQEPSQGIFIYSCMTRRYFMGDEIESEILPLQNIAPVSGFFTYGEFFTSNKKELFNQTMTLASLSESEEIHKIHLKPRPTEVDINSASIEALIHLINVSSNEVEKQTQTLKESHQVNKELKERMELALLGSNDGIWDWNILDNSVYFSPRWKEMLGYQDHELPNVLSTWESRLHPDDIEKTWADATKNINGETEYYENVHRLKHKDGHWVWIHDRGKVQYDEHGKATRMIGTHTDISEEKENQMKLVHQAQMIQHQAHHDALTGLPNRILFFDRLDQGIIQAKRHKEGLALFFIDLDQFKHINDSLGHQVGDKVLKTVSKRLEDIIRKEDTLSRLSGDEFTVIMSELTHAEDASLLAGKILNILEKPIAIDTHMLYVTGSIGISLYPQDATDAQSLLKYADTAMYKAKEEGRNNFQFYAAEMTTFALSRMAMKTSLRQAIDNEEFVIHYQSQINASTNTLVGVEALVRWDHPTMGFLMPDEFIPLAEETGMIIEIDQWVMQTAMKSVSQWYKEGLNPGVLGINLSVKQLEKTDFIQKVETCMKGNDFDPKWLELEITERQMMKKSDEVITKLHQINDLGISISIDDFGTGYSSLSLLKRLPINRLKIDRSFIKDIPEDKEDVGIVKAIIALAKSLKLSLIAEGVETSEQIDFLIENGCLGIQGHYYNHPLPAEEMRNILLKNKEK